MRDRLPDLLHDRLPAALRADVQAHVDGCVECRAELAILRQVVAVTSAPPVDATRIAASLPPYRPMPVWRRAALSPLLRIAAAVVLLAGGAVAIRSVVSRTDEPGEPRTAQTPGATMPTVVPTNIGPSKTVDTTVGARRPTAPAPTELAVGESFHDLSDSELRVLLDELGRFEAVTPSETDVVVPSLGRGGA